MRRAKPFFFFLLSAAISLTAFSQTNIPGGVVSGTWTTAGSPYLVQGNIMIANGTVLTIQPGVTVSFQGSYRMLVSGRLVAAGTDADSIRFTAANTTTGWQGIRFDNTASTNDSSLLDRCSIEYSIANGMNGGGVSVRNFSKLRITNNAISNCWVVGVRGGGGIYVENSTILISKNKLFRNHAVSGGGILVSGGSPVITENIISYNDNDQPGGGLGDPGSDPDSYGGGISITAANGAVVTNNTITYNRGLNGGGVHVDAVSASVTNNIINYNEGGLGGGVYDKGGGTFTGNSISYNTGLIMAGGIYSGSSLFQNNKITYNIAAKAGGGIMLPNGVSPVIVNNLVANNSVSGPLDTDYQGGGGFYIIGGDSTRVISGNVVVNNSGINGGAFMFYTSGAKLQNNTVANNNAVKGGAVFCHSGTSPVLVNTILWGNTASTAGQQIFLNDDACDPYIRFSDIMGGEAAIDANGNFYTGEYQNNINSNPLFVAASAGSGTGFDGTTADWSLANNSPAIDAGMPGGTYPATDYAGNLRVVSGVIDIGAIEAQISIPPTATVSGGGTVCPGVALPSVIFTFTPGTFPLTLVYSINGVQQPPVTGINTLQYTIANAAPGVYAVVFISDPLSTGSGIGQATVQVEQPVADFIVNSSNQCLVGNNFIFTDASSVNGAVITGWAWRFGDGATATTAFANHSYANAGIYDVWLIVTSSAGCKDTVTKTTITTAFTVNMLPDTVRTYDDSVVLNAGTGYTHYQWNTGDTTRTITVRNNGKYVVTVTNAMGCTASDSSYVDLRKRKTLFIGNQQNLCPLSSFAMPVRTKNITNVIGLQGTIRWNQLASITLDSVTFNNTAVNMTAANINLSNISSGFFTYSWNDNTLSGKTVADSTTLFTMWFTKTAASAATTQPVSFSSSPTALEIDSINLSTHTPVIVTETSYINGSAQFRGIAATTGVQLAACDSVVYNNTAYYANTLVYDTIKYAGLSCDSLIKAVNIVVYDTTITPSISIVASATNIINGTPVTFTATYSFGGNAPAIQWYKNNVAIPGETGVQYITNTLSGRDTVYAVLTSSLSCATDSPQVTSNRIGVVVRYNVSGTIRGPQGATTRQPSVGFTGIANAITTSGTNGFYSTLLYGGPGHNYVARPFKTNDLNKTNGVSTLDIAIIQSHILSSTLFTSPYQWVAADVNRSRSVTSLDILQIQRLILGSIGGFGPNGVWTFIDTANGGFNPLAPLQYRDTVVLNELHTDITNLNFTAVKLGDVNFDYNNTVARPLPSAAKPVVFYYDDIAAGNERRIKVPVKVKDFKNVLGMQFTLGFNVSVLQFAGIDNNRLNIKFADNRKDEGKLTFIWNDAYNKLATLADGDVLMELLFDVTSTFTEEDITVNSDITTAELWDGAYTKHSIVKGSGKISKQKAGAIDFTKESFEVSPNPSTGPVQVTVRSLSYKNITVTVQAADGKIVHTQKISVISGTNSITLNMNAIPAAGVYYLKLSGLDKELPAKKLVIIK